MILIAISFIYITLLITPMGIGFLKLIKANTSDVVINAVAGLLATTLLASIWAFFYRIHIEFHILLLLASITLSVIFWKDVKLLCSSFLLDVKALPKWLKLLLVINVLLIVMQCAAAPYVFDNESYYIQTIKWLNEYGFVKGLGNLHIFFAQSSGWHIAQSAFNFSFLSPDFNDLSGYCLLLGNLYSFQKLDLYFKGRQFINLVIGLFPLANFFLFQFISAPSPDIPVYVFSFLVFSLFMEQFSNPDPNGFKLMVLITIFTVYCKVTAIALCLLPLMILVFHYKPLKRAVGYSLLLGTCVLLLFIAKNYILTGYLLYPLVGLDVLSLDWKIPHNLATDLLSIDKLKGKGTGFLGLVMQWIKKPGFEGLFSKLSVVLIVVLPFIIRKYFNKKGIWLMYTAMILQLILLLYTSPQYRFYLNFTLFFGLLITALLLKNSIVLKAAMVLTCILTVIMVFVPLRLGGNKIMVHNSTFRLRYAVEPHANTKLTSEYEKLTELNLEYYTPKEKNYIWLTGNAGLPATNKSLIEFIKKKYAVIPQTRGKEIGEGFYAKETKPGE